MPIIPNIGEILKITSNYLIDNIIYSFIGNNIYLSDLVKYKNIDFYIKPFIFTKLIIDKISDSICLENNIILLKQIFNKFRYIEFILDSRHNNDIKNYIKLI